MQRIGAKLKRIGFFIERAAQNDIDRQQSAQRFQTNIRSANREVATFDERVAQVASQVRVLKVAGAARSSGKEHDAGIVAMLAGERLQRVAERDEKAGQPLDMETVEIGGQDARGNDAILKGQSRSRKPLRVVGENAPLAVCAACEGAGIHVKEDVARRGDAVARQKKRPLAENNLRRQQSLANQVLRAVQVDQDQIKQVRALGERVGQRIPFALGQQQRQGVELPETIGP